MIGLKKILELLLLFLCVSIYTMFCSQSVLCKEIKYEMRGIHLNLNDFDFVSSEFSVEEFKNYIVNSYDLAKENGFNTIFVDMSGFIDLYTTEKFNEKHENLVSYIVKEGFKRCLDIHACFSDFSLKDLGDENNIEMYLASLPEGAFIKDNIEWIVKFDDRYYLDLGIREVRDHFINLIVDLSNKFKFDGVYLDNIGYPENINKYVFNDSYGYVNYNEDKLSKEVWRRQNVNDFLKILGEKFKSYKNELKFGVGANYIWRTIEDDVNGINYKGYSDYDKGSFDSLNIGKMNYVNYMVIKIGDDIKNKDDIEDIVCWWEKKFRTYSVDVFIQGDENIRDVIEKVRENFFVNGFMVKNYDNIHSIADLLYKKSMIPRYKSFDSYYTVSDIHIVPKLRGEDLEFSILNDGFENTKGFVVYKFPYDNLDLTDGDYIDSIIPSQGKLTKLNFKKSDGVYAITKFNYNSIESMVNSVFIVGDDIGLVEGKLLPNKVKVVNEEVEINLSSSIKGNEFKFSVEKDGEILIHNEFSSEVTFKFVPEKSGIYRINISVVNKDNNSNVVNSYLNIEVKDYYDVVLDAGHGGDEYGARTQDGVLEKDINLSICNHVTNLFKDVKKINVKNVRVNDIKIDLSDRVKICSFLGGDIFLSIHQNAFDNESVNGVETYYYIKESFSRRLSEIVQNNLVSETNAFDRGIKNSNFVVLRENIVPSILIECGFITNIHELDNLIEEEYQKSISKGIFNAVNRFLELEEI